MRMHRGVQNVRKGFGLLSQGDRLVARLAVFPGVSTSSGKRICDRDLQVIWGHAPASLWGHKLHAPNDAPKQTKSPRMLANVGDIKYRFKSTTYKIF